MRLNEKQKHEAESKCLAAKQHVELAASKNDYARKNADVVDLIVALVAKENMPLRIIESPYFRRLLEGDDGHEFIFVFSGVFIFIF